MPVFNKVRFVALKQYCKKIGAVPSFRTLFALQIGLIGNNIFWSIFGRSYMQKELILTLLFLADLNFTKIEIFVCSRQKTFFSKLDFSCAFYSKDFHFQPCFISNRLKSLAGLVREGL